MVVRSSAKVAIMSRKQRGHLWVTPFSEDQWWPITPLNWLVEFGISHWKCKAYWWHFEKIQQEKRVVFPVVSCLLRIDHWHINSDGDLTQSWKMKGANLKFLGVRPCFQRSVHQNHGLDQQRLRTTVEGEHLGLLSSMINLERKQE